MYMLVYGFHKPQIERIRLWSQVKTGAKQAKEVYRLSLQKNPAGVIWIQ